MMRLQQSTFYKYGKIVLLFYLLVACCAKVFGQNKQKEIDRLIVQVPMLMRSYASSAKKQIAIINHLSNQYHYQHGKIESAFFRSWIKYREASTDDCIISIDSALKNIALIEKDSSVVKFYILKGQCYVKKRLFNHAVDHFSMALDIAEKNKDITNKTGALISIGWAYMENAKPLEAINFFNEVLRLNPQKKYQNRATVLCNIASCYNLLKHYQYAEKYALQGIRTAKELNSVMDLANGLNILARSYYHRNQFPKAKLYLHEASIARAKIADPAMLASDYLELADVYNKSEMPAAGIEYARKAELIAQKNKIDLKLENAYTILSKLYSKTGDYKRAASYYEKLISLRKENESEDYVKALAELQVKYDSEKKASENLKLKEENLENRLNISNKQRWLIILIASLSVFISSSIYFYFYIQNKYKSQNAVQRFLEEKNKAVAILETEENERRRISGDLHDGVGQTLAAASLQLKKAKNDIAQLQKLDDLIDQAANEVRMLSHEMTPEMVLHFGLVKAMEQVIDRLNDVQNFTVFKFFKHVEFDDVNQVRAVVVYRSFQELTNNILKHAKAKNVGVHLNMSDDEILLMIEDDGIGYDKNEIKLGLGLQNLESRIRIFNGHLEVDSTIGKGTTTILRFSY
ncbi:histidine kinase [Pedobacter agri]|uniref:histidine kinase n=1 Tax=Pedobacter agri TaxID=454586 RepID=A0A9X3DM79_9SPHI|nr:histidine kinase [Pedobacter agri]MCX3266973.1 histidine kinase [Pedobacter agri]